MVESFDHFRAKIIISETKFISFYFPKEIFVIDIFEFELCEWD